VQPWPVRSPNGEFVSVLHPGAEAISDTKMQRLESVTCAIDFRLNLQSRTPSSDLAALTSWSSTPESAPIGPFAETSVEELEEMIDVNVKGAIYTVRAALPHLISSPEPDLIMLASEAGRRALPGEAVYVASKFAQVGLIRSLDHELRPAGVRCTSICPGGVATQFGMGRGLRYPNMPELENMLTDQDVAETVLFALSRPRSHRLLEIALRHMSEPSLG
jgi:NAD(P)-dependent dehydrogenase (short-subunit alcohol dehydrogenase family)